MNRIFQVYIVPAAVFISVVMWAVAMAPAAR